MKILSFSQDFLFMDLYGGSIWNPFRNLEFDTTGDEDSFIVYNDNEFQASVNYIETPHSIAIDFAYKSYYTYLYNKRGNSNYIANEIFNQYLEDFELLEDETPLRYIYDFNFNEGIMITLAKEILNRNGNATYIIDFTPIIKLVNHGLVIDLSNEKISLKFDILEPKEFIKSFKQVIKKLKIKF